MIIFYRNSGVDEDIIDDELDFLEYLYEKYEAPHKKYIHTFVIGFHFLYLFYS